MMWEDDVNRDLKVVKIITAKKQAKGRNVADIEGGTQAEGV
jgi:hypothetical protein